METIKSSPAILIVLTIGLFGNFSLLHAQSRSNEEASTPKSDANSLRIIKNYLQASGGPDAHEKLRNVVAEGTIKESTLERSFRLIETADGKRHLTYFWTHLGRAHRVVYGYDGIQTWTRILEPKEKDAVPYGGIQGAHFAHQRWLLQPFDRLGLARRIFQYRGSARVNGRSAYMIEAVGDKAGQSWFYFNQENFLLVRWGGEGLIAGVRENIDYGARRFKAVRGVLLPQQIDLIAENDRYGQVQFELIAANQDLSGINFSMPQSSSPILRQRTISRD